MPVATVLRPEKAPPLKHDCVDYPITFYIAASAVNSGSLVAPRIIGASSVWHGQGHPLNRTEILYPDSEGYMPNDSHTDPRLSIISRRALLRGLLQALVSVKDIYRIGKASTCLHICVSSKYLDLVWNEWLPDWDQNGWPTRADEDASSMRRPVTVEPPAKMGRARAPSRASTRLSTYSRAESTMSAMSGMSGLSGVTGDAQLIYDDDSNRLINEDLLRKIAIFRRNYFANSPTNLKGSAYVQLVHYRHNPGDRLAKEAARAAAMDLTTQLPRARSLNTFDTGSIYSANSDNIMGGRNRSRRQSIVSNSTSIRSPKSHAASLPSSLVVAAPAKSASRSAPMIVTRPSQQVRSRNSYAISEHGTETDVEDFNDALTTLSEPEDAPKSSIAKVAALPSTVVAATVDSVLAPSDQVERATAPFAAAAGKPEESARGSFAVETNEALAAVRAPSIDGPLPPSTSVNGARQVPMAATSAASVGDEDVERGAAPPLKLSPRLSSISNKAPPQKVSAANEITSAKASPPKAGPSLSKESSVRKERPAMVKENPREVPKDTKLEAPPKPKQRNSFLSLRRNKPERSGEPQPHHSNKAAYKPSTDRLIDYRPPHMRNLGASRQAEEKITTPSSHSPMEENPPLPVANRSGEKGSTRRGPFSFFRKRGSVKEVF